MEGYWYGGLRDYGKNAVASYISSVGLVGLVGAALALASGKAERKQLE